MTIDKTEYRGSDARFAKDARVLITATPEDFNEYLQMLGRASRSRNLCEGVMFTSTSEKPTQVLQRLKGSNVSSMQDLERLARLLKEKSKDKALVTLFKQLTDQGKTVRTCKELGDQLGATAYSKLVKAAKL